MINKFRSKYEISNDLYLELIKQSKDEANFDVQNIVNAYIQSLPSNLQVKIFDQLYDNMFRKIYFLQNKPNKFIDWIQPLLKQ